MPEKTLKDKVDAARINLASITHVSHFDVKNVFEALTALEEELQRARDALTGQAHRDEQLSKSIDTAMHTVARAKGILKGEGFYIAGDELDSVLLTLDEAKHKYTPEEK